MYWLMCEIFICPKIFYLCLLQLYLDNIEQGLYLSNVYELHLRMTEKKDEDWTESEE